MTRRLLASYLGLTVAVLIALEVPLAVVDARNERQDLTAKVERDAFAVASLAEDTLQHGAASPSLQRIVVHYQSGTGGRVVIVDRHGRRVADSHPTTPNETEFATEARPEILSALHGHVATGIRYSTTLHTRLLYVAVPVASGGKLLGAVRITYPTSTLHARVNRYRLALLAVGLIVIAVAAVIGLVLARSVSRPLRRLEQVLDNLLANALEAAPRGSVVSVRVDAAGLHDGPGLTAEQRAHAFDRFWRAGSGPGSGLGLAIAKRLVELDGGEIELAASPSGGVDAAVRYPVLRASRARSPAATVRS